jgi:hypothetical protein
MVLICKFAVSSFKANRSPDPMPEDQFATLGFATLDFPSLEPHGILDGHHARDAARDLDRLVNIRLGIDEAAQLHHPFEGFDIDLSRTQRRLIENGRLHFAGKDGIVHIFSGSLLFGR